jgi:hypothetical protein
VLLDAALLLVAVLLGAVLVGVELVDDGAGADELVTVLCVGVGDGVVVCVFEAVALGDAVDEAEREDVVGDGVGVD